MLSSKIIAPVNQQYRSLFLKIFIAIIALSEMFSCTATTRMYADPQLPRNAICIIACKERLVVDRIDGKSVYIQPVERRFKLLPGEHTITLELCKKEPVLLVWYLSSYNNKENLTFTCRPGEAYFISFDVDYRNKKWKPFMFLTYP
jgi:hypothetical protein